MTIDTAQTSAPWLDKNAKPLLEIKHLSKNFGDVIALADVSLSIYQGEFFALLGPSGCGKSTLLRILAGFEKPSSGAVYLQGENIVDVPVYQRRINMMFQSYALFPHMSVEQNVMFGLKQEKLSAKEIKQRCEEALEMVQLSDLAKRKPQQLSGGQQQRTALARSLIKRPKLLLLDEPLTALDKKLREETQFQLVDLQEELEMTFVIVTHDQAEAMTMASRIAVINQGKIAQLETPMAIYEQPNSRFVADFIGDVNLLSAVLKSHLDSQITVYCPEAKTDFFISENQQKQRSIAEDTPVTYAIRPEKITVNKYDENNPITAENQVIGEVVDIGYLGNRSVYYVRLESGKVIVASTNNHVRLEFMSITWKNKVVLSWPSASALLFDDENTPN